MLPFVRRLKEKPRFVGEWGRVSTNSLRAERMSVAASVSLSDATLDRDASVPYQALGMSRNPRARRRQITAPVGRDEVTAPIPVVSATGMRRNAGVAAVTVFCFVLGVLFLMQLSEMTEMSKSVARTKASITQTQQDIAEMEANLARKTSEINVGYEAARLGMISANGVDVIYLMAPETRDAAALLSAETEVEPAHSEFFAALLGR